MIYSLVHQTRILLPLIFSNILCATSIARKPSISETAAGLLLLTASTNDFNSSLIALTDFDSGFITAIVFFPCFVSRSKVNAFVSEDYWELKTFYRETEFIATIDRLRSVMIALVILHHTAITLPATAAYAL